MISMQSWTSVPQETRETDIPTVEQSPKTQSTKLVQVSPSLVQSPLWMALKLKAEKLGEWGPSQNTPVMGRNSGDTRRPIASGPRHQPRLLAAQNTYSGQDIYTRS